MSSYGNHDEIMDQYNRLLDVFNNDPNASRISKTHAKMQPDEFSKESKSVESSTTTKQQQSILSSILNQADTQVRNLTGAYNKNEKSNTSRSLTNKSNSSNNRPTIPNGKMHRNVINENDDTSYDINKNELILDNVTNKTMRMFYASPRKISADQQQIVQNQIENNRVEDLDDDEEVVIVDEPTDNDLLTYENLLEDDINSDQRKIKLVNLDSEEVSDENVTTNQNDLEQQNMDDTDMILNTENELTTEYDNIDLNGRDYEVDADLTNQMNDYHDQQQEENHFQAQNQKKSTTHYASNQNQILKTSNQNKTNTIHKMKQKNYIEHEKGFNDRKGKPHFLACV